MSEVKYSALQTIASTGGRHLFIAASGLLRPSTLVLAMMFLFSCTALAQQRYTQQAPTAGQSGSHSMKIRTGWSSAVYKNDRLVRIGRYVLSEPLLLPKCMLAVNEAYVYGGSVHNRAILVYFYFRADYAAKIRDWAGETPPKVPLLPGSFKVRFPMKLTSGNGNWTAGVIAITRLGAESFSWNASTITPKDYGRPSSVSITADEGPPGYDGGAPIGHQKRLLYLAASLRWLSTVPSSSHHGAQDN